MTTIGEITVASVYVPNGNKDFQAKMRFLEALEAFARAQQEARRPLVICGDLNVARTERDVHPKERKPRAIGQLPEERAMLERILSCGLVDVGRTVPATSLHVATVAQHAPANIGWRLDRPASTALASQTSCPVHLVGMSDHA
jgi:exodeoxyribonuclease-3